MKINRIKLILIAVAFVSVFAVVAFNVNSASSISKDIHTISNTNADDDVAASYKKQCAVCHSPKAEKAFDPAKPIDEHTQIILKGKKGEKPPFMPGYESKGMTQEQAKALAEYMVRLRNPNDSNTNTSGNTNTLNNTNTSDNTNTFVPSDDEVAAAYKTKCAMCHSPKAEKAFDPTKEDETLMNVVLKGNPASKPPMPGYEAKGMKPTEAMALVAYMKGLRDGLKK